MLSMAIQQATSNSIDYSQFTDDGHHRIKIICLGDSAVGKSKLVERFIGDEFTPYQMSTYAVTVYHRKMMVKDEPVLVDIWDTAGQEQFNSMHASYYHQAHACILVFDVTRKLTYKNLIPWYRELREYRSEIPCLCAANKIDVNYEVTRRNFMLPKKYSMPLYLVSASDGTNVVKLFEDAIDLALKYKKNPSDFMDVVLQELESLDVGDDFDGE